MISDCGCLEFAKQFLIKKGRVNISLVSVLMVRALVHSLSLASAIRKCPGRVGSHYLIEDNNTPEGGIREDRTRVVLFIAGNVALNPGTSQLPQESKSSSSTQDRKKKGVVDQALENKMQWFLT
jgi:hypothetical protein